MFIVIVATGYSVSDRHLCWFLSFVFSWQVYGLQKILLLMTTKVCVTGFSFSLSRIFQSF